MKTKYLPLAGLFLIGILSASGSTAAAAPISLSISSAHITEIALPGELNAIQLKTIYNIIDDDIQIGLLDAKTTLTA